MLGGFICNAKVFIFNGNTFPSFLPYMPIICSKSIGGTSGKEYKPNGIWSEDCPIFNT